MEKTETTIQDRGTIITTIAEVLIKRRFLPVQVRGGIEEAARFGWDEALGGPHHEDRFSACASAYNQGYWAAKNLEKLGLERILEITRA